MLAGPAVVSYSSDDSLVFRGAVLEGLNGKSLDKRLEEDPSFCDIDFLLACLQKVGAAPSITEEVELCSCTLLYNETTACQGRDPLSQLLSTACPSLNWSSCGTRGVT
jgi:hypothetical protein